VSDLVRRQLIECGTPAEKIEVVYNGVDLDAFSPGPGQRSDFGLPEGCFIAMFAGDIRTSRKNLDTVLRAMTEIAGVHLAIAGSTARSPYPAMARALGIAERVHFLELRSDMAALMRAVDAFVFPSRFEPFGLVVLEASACGLPVVTSRAVGACEALTGDGMIVLDEPNDVPRLAAALDMLASDATLCQRLGRCGRAAAERLSAKASAAQHSRLIERIADQVRA
jgi:glycosyltransferase involved in cell wall biosynthesis